MNKLFLADTHLTDKPRDEYRWGIFPALKRWVEKYQVDEIWLLGDLTDSKEGHCAEFVNRIVTEVSELSESAPVFILRGNHDYSLSHCGFFEFLDKLPNVHWIDTITAVGDVLCFPHSKHPSEEWPEHLEHAEDYKYIVFHQCFLGASSSLGYTLSGTDLDLTKLKTCKAYAGDIHMPQKVKGVEYIGSPYPTTYGDRFLGRCILETETGRKQLHYQTIQKCTLVISDVSEIYDARLYPGDQVKVRFKISKKDTAGWVTIKGGIRAACKDLGVILGGTEMLTEAVPEDEMVETPAELVKTSERGILEQFAAKEQLPDKYLSVGLTILGDL